MIFVCPFYTDDRKSLLKNLSEFTSVSWQPSFFTFKTILTMADGDPDFINPVGSFVDACFAKERQSPNKIMIFAKMFTYLRPTTVTCGLLRGPHRELLWQLTVGTWQMNGGDCVQHIRVDACTSEHLGVSIIYQPMSTVINHYIGSLFGNWLLFIPMFFILSCIVLRACPLSSPVSISYVYRSPCLNCM